jgi:hypothetical protein
LAFGVAPKSREVSPTKSDKDKEDIEMSDEEEELKKEHGSPKKSQSP